MIETVYLKQSGRVIESEEASLHNCEGTRAAYTAMIRGLSGSANAVHPSWWCEFDSESTRIELGVTTIEQACGV